jgi:AcrR family transcriptional regulator
MSSSPTLRSDAQRNRERLLDAAAGAFAEHGLGVGVAEIARRAGVGQGTLFRRFPTKEALVAAIVIDRLDELAALAARAAALEPDEAVPWFMAGAVRLYVQDRALYEAVEGPILARPDVREAHQRLFGALDRLVAHAQAGGALRADVAALDIPVLVVAVSHAAGPLLSGSPRIWRRYLGVVLDGLRPAAATPLPVRAPTAREFDRACRASSTTRPAPTAR